MHATGTLFENDESVPSSMQRGLWLGLQRNTGVHDISSVGALAQRPAPAHDTPDEARNKRSPKPGSAASKTFVVESRLQAGTHGTDVVCSGA